MLTVKDLNSILSEIFCNSQNTQRSFKPSQNEEKSEKSQSFWSVEESAIFSESQLREKNKSVKKRSKLVKESVNKGILLKKFKPFNFITGIQNHFDDKKKVKKMD